MNAHSTITAIPPARRLDADLLELGSDREIIAELARWHEQHATTLRDIGSHAKTERWRIAYHGRADNHLAVAAWLRRKITRDAVALAPEREVA